MPPKAARKPRPANRADVTEDNVIGGPNSNPYVRTRSQRHLPINPPSNFADIEWGRGGVRLSAAETRAKKRAAEKEAADKAKEKEKRRKERVKANAKSAGLRPAKSGVTKKKKATTTKAKPKTKVQEGKHVPRTDRTSGTSVPTPNPVPAPKPKQKATRVSTVVEGSQGTSGVSSAPSTLKTRSNSPLKGKSKKVTKKAAAPKKNKKAAPKK